MSFAFPAYAQDRGAVLDTYADIAQAGYEDSLITAERLQAAVAALVETPSAEALQAARAAWLAARVPYQQTEVFRFGNAIVDDWEGRVNAWPLDEGLIDHVDGDAYGRPTDENEFEAKVAAGYHAIEFLLWGQDLNGHAPAALEPFDQG